MQPVLSEVRMSEIRRVLCPVDFSDASRHALDHAVMIAQEHPDLICLDGRVVLKDPLEGCRGR